MKLVRMKLNYASSRAIFLLLLSQSCAYLKAAQPLEAEEEKYGYNLEVRENAYPQKEQYQLQVKMVNELDANAVVPAMQVNLKALQEQQIEGFEMIRNHNEDRYSLIPIKNRRKENILTEFSEGDYNEGLKQKLLLSKKNFYFDMASDGFCKVTFRVENKTASAYQFKMRFALWRGHYSTEKGPFKIDGGKSAIFKTSFKVKAQDQKEDDCDSVELEFNDVEGK